MKCIHVMYPYDEGCDLIQIEDYKLETFLKIAEEVGIGAKEVKVNELPFKSDGIVKNWVKQFGLFSKEDEVFKYPFEKEAEELINKYNKL